jgi:WD40 repeat protein
VQTVEVLIEQNALGTVRPMEVAANAPVAALVPAIVDELQLPQTDLFGNRLVYMLRYAPGGPVVPENKSLLAAGIRSGARLALDSVVLDKEPVATLTRDGMPAKSAEFYNSQTIADPAAFSPLPRVGIHTSASLPVVNKPQRGRWTRRAFLLATGAVLGVGTTGLGYAAYRSYLMPSSMTKNLPAKIAQGTPAHPTATATTFMTPKGARAALTFTQHHQTVRVVTWSPNGTMLASGANDGFLFTWNLNDVVQLQIRPGDRVRALAWSPDGQQLAAGIGTHVVFFNALTGVKLGDGAQHKGIVSTLSWSPLKPLRVVSGAADKTAIVWDGTNYTPQTVFTRHPTPLTSASWAADGTTIATASQGGVARIWNANNGQQVHGFYMDTPQPDRVLAFAPVGSMLAVGADDGVVRLWNGLTCQKTSQDGNQCLDTPQRIHASNGPVRSLGWSPDGRFLATGGDDGSLSVWNPMQSQTPLLTVHHNAPVFFLSWSPNGNQIAAASGNNVTIWELF